MVLHLFSSLDFGTESSPTESNHAKLIVRKLLDAGWKPEEQVTSFFLDEK
jgi:hypothetical protein